MPGILNMPEFRACSRTAIPLQHLTKPIGITSQSNFIQQTLSALLYSPHIQTPFNMQAAQQPKLSLSKPGRAQTKLFFRPAPIQLSKTQPLPRSASRITTSATGLYRHNHTSERPLCRLSAFFRTFLTSLVFQLNFYCNQTASLAVLAAALTSSSHSRICRLNSALNNLL